MAARASSTRSGTFQGTNPGDLGGSINHQAAIGDIDGDGVPEWVVGVGDRLMSGHLQDTVVPVEVTFPANVSDAISLADLNLSGGQETIVPLANGQLHVLRSDGNPYHVGWPYQAAGGVALTSAAVAQTRGSSRPEIAVATSDLETYLFFDDASPCLGFPVSTGLATFNAAPPIIGAIEGSPDVIQGSRDHCGWAWNNFGSVIPGWPKDTGSEIWLAPALGDLDQDGRLEIVLLTLSQMVIVDVNQAPSATPEMVWAMDGHDARRSGCADCPEDLVTPVAESGGVTRVSFAAPYPNPVMGTCQFSYAVPERARVELQIYDVRGARIATVMREESTPGPHVVTWTGRDRQGRPVTSGLYFARLSVRGPRLNEVLTREVTILR